MAMPSVAASLRTLKHARLHARRTRRTRHRRQGSTGSTGGTGGAGAMAAAAAAADAPTAADDADDAVSTCHAAAPPAAAAATASPTAGAATAPGATAAVVPGATAAAARTAAHGGATHAATCCWFWAATDAVINQNVRDHAPPKLQLQAAGRRVLSQNRNAGLLLSLHSEARRPIVLAIQRRQLHHCYVLGVARYYSSISSRSVRDVVVRR